MAVGLTGEAVDDFVESAVSAAGDNELAAFLAGAQGDFGGVARTGGFGQVGFNAALCEDFAGFIELFAAAIAATTGVGVVD